MKKYFVSLAAVAPCNFEVKVEADSKEQALKLALSKWEHKVDHKDITEPDWEESKLDIEKFKNIDDLGNGICVEER